MIGRPTPAPKYEDWTPGICSTVWPTVLPRWSYVMLDGDQVVEAAEKNPISRHAIAGFYYFRRGDFFIDAAARSMLQRVTQDGRYFIAPALNQLIIDGRRVIAKSISNEAYLSFFTPHRIEEFEARHGQRIAARVAKGNVA